MWPTLIPIIAQYGIPLAEALWRKWTSGAAPTQADWDELRALGAKTMRSQMVDALTRAGIALDSAQAIELLKGL